MTIEEIDKIIQDLRQQIPNLQMQLHQAEGYKQALVDLEKKEEPAEEEAEEAPVEEKPSEEKKEESVDVKYKKDK